MELVGAQRSQLCPPFSPESPRELQVGGAVLLATTLASILSQIERLRKEAATMQYAGASIEGGYLVAR